MHSLTSDITGGLKEQNMNFFFFFSLACYINTKQTFWAFFLLFSLSSPCICDAQHDSWVSKPSSCKTNPFLLHNGMNQLIKVCSWMIHFHGCCVFWVCRFGFQGSHTFWPPNLYDFSHDFSSHLQFEGLFFKGTEITFIFNLRFTWA